MTNPRKRRIAAATALATSLTAVFAALGGISVAQSAISAVQYQYGPRVEICHKGKTIKVAKAAVPAHVRHGDTVGPCSSEAAKAKAAKVKAAKAKAEQAKAKAKQAKPGHEKVEAEKPAAEKPGNDNGKGRGRGK